MYQFIHYHNRFTMCTLIIKFDLNKRSYYPGIYPSQWKLQDIVIEIIEKPDNSKDIQDILTNLQDKVHSAVPHVQSQLISQLAFLLNQEEIPVNNLVLTNCVVNLKV